MRWLLNHLIQLSWTLLSTPLGVSTLDIHSFYGFKSFSFSCFINTDFQKQGVKRAKWPTLNRLFIPNKGRRGTMFETTADSYEYDKIIVCIGMSLVPEEISGLMEGWQQDATG